MSATETKETFGAVIRGDVPVLVDFSAEWCGPCKMMKPVLQELHQMLGEKVRILKIDIDQNPNTASAYHIQSVPTLVLFQKGEVKWRQSGVVPAPQLAGIIKQHVG